MLHIALLIMGVASHHRFQKLIDLTRAHHSCAANAMEK